MAVLAPALPQQTISYPPTVASVPAIATSQFSAGGVMAPTAANNFNNTPVNYATGFNNPYANQYNGGGAIQPQQSNPITGLMSNASTIRSAGQFVSNGFALPQSSMLNSLGASSGLFGSGGLSYTTAGALPWQTAGSVANSAMAGGGLGAEGVSVGASQGALGAGTLSSALGAAGIGALAGNFLGKIGGNSTNGSIGGGVGAGIGMAVAGPVGAIIGGLVGGIGGGFFGPKAPTAASESQIDFDNTGSAVVSGMGEKNAGQYTGYNKQISSLLTDKINTIKGVIPDFKFASGEQLYAGVNTKHSVSGQPGYIYVKDKQGNIIKSYGFDPNDNDAMNKATTTAITDLFSRNGASNEQISTALNTLAANETNKGMPMVTRNTAPNTAFADFVNNYKASIAPKGNTNNVTTTTDQPSTPTA